MTAFSPREVEDPVDAYFFRPLGGLLVRPAARLGLTPTQVTLISMVIGAIGGGLLCDLRFAPLGFVLLVFYSVLDSTDGQLARLTGQTTELGRVLDGAIGYVVHVAIYLGIMIGLLARGTDGWVLLCMLMAAISNVLQAQMYEYHRYHYASVVLKGRVVRDQPANISSSLIATLYRAYLATQRALTGGHAAVEARIAARAENGIVREQDRVRYRQDFRATVRGWNWLGDNWRIAAIGLAAALQRMELFFFILLLPLNLILLVLWFWQRRVDRNFLRNDSA